jgi:hypothetical protein
MSPRIGLCEATGLGYIPLISYVTIDRLQQKLASDGFSLLDQKAGPIHTDLGPMEEQIPPSRKFDRYRAGHLIQASNSGMIERFR